MSLSKSDVESLILLAEAARPIDDDDWGSERQVGAENAFCVEIMDVQLKGHPDLIEAVDRFSLKATVDERINYMMSLVIEMHYNDNGPGVEPFFVDASSGIEINNPYSSSCGRFDVTPSSNYPEFSAWLETVKAARVDARPSP